MEKPDENRSVWRRLIESHVPLLVTAAMFTFLVLKVLSAANGEPETALAVLTAVGVAQIVMGVIVSSYGLFMFVLLSWAVYWGVSATCEEEPNGEHTIWPPLALAVAAGLAILFLDSILLGIVAIILSVGVLLAGSRVARRLDTARRRIVRMVFLGVVLLVSLAFMSLGVMTGDVVPGGMV